MTLSGSLKFFLLLCVFSAAVWWQTICRTFRLAVGNEAYTHILLVVPACAVLIALRLRGAAADSNPNRRPGLVLLTLAALIGIAGLHWNETNSSAVGLRWTLEVLALVTWWIGSFVICFGFRTARTCTFPLLFLLWLVPMPQTALAHVIAFLQQGTATVAREMFAVIGVPVRQSGTLLTVPGLSAEVAEECSSIRSSMILVLVATVMACLMLRSYWSRTLVILLSVPLAVAKNALRVFTLVGLGAYVDPAVLNSPLHHQGGILFLAIALVMLFIVVRLALRLEVQEPKTGTPASVMSR